MPINTDLNIAPYFDDFDLEKQFYKILFKPAYAVQARELTQLQSILQNQIEQFGDNIYQEGSIIKGCNFTTLNGLKYVKLKDATGFDVESYVSGPSTAIIGGIEKEVEVIYQVTGSANGLTASILAASRGFETRPPDLNTWFINYLTTSGSIKEFQPGEYLTVSKYVYDGASIVPGLTETNLVTIQVTNLSPAVGSSYGIRASSGVIFQKGHFLFADDQTLIVDKYSNSPDDLSVGYQVNESLITALSDNSLYDNALGSNNYNAPGADRLKLIPELVVKDTAEADVDPAFFTLIRYQNGSAVQLRDVTQFNSINEAMAQRTFEESGNYIVNKFKVDLDRRDGALTALVGAGTAYVKGYRVENSGIVDFTIDTVQATAIHDNQAISINYGSYVDIVSINGTVALDNSQAELQDASFNALGYCYIRNITPTRLYIYGVTMGAGADFANVTKIVSTAGSITIAAGSRIKNTSQGPAIFRTGTKYVKSTSDTVLPLRTVKSLPVISNTITINADPNGYLGLDQSDLVVVDSSNTLIPVSSYSTDPGNTVLTVNLTAGSAANATVYYNQQFTGSGAADPYIKSLVEPYIKSTYLTSKTKYSLGFPDVISIEDIYDGTTGTRYTDSFALRSNQTDHFYDISYMEYIAGRPVPANNTVLTIKLKVFKATPGNQYYFSINSYPVDDDTEILPAGYIRSSDISVYRGTNGVVYNLRESFDFRPHVDKDPLADYTKLSANLAPTVNTAVGAIAPTFSGTYAFPVQNAVIQSDVEYYLARKDVITIDSYGRLALIKGTEEYEPVQPRVSPDMMIVSEISIPGHPALSPKEAADQGKSGYAARVKSLGTKNYTMRDIQKLEQRIEGMEYYISLSQLEQDTENLTVLDENGLTRFKNGYVVDPMKDTRVADINNPEYKAAVHFDRSILTPALATFPLDLRYKSRSNVSLFPSTNNPEVASLSRSSNVKLLGQPYATNFRNCVSNFYKYDGTGALSPSHDMLQDPSVNPTPVELDLYSIFNDLNEQMPITGVNWSGEIRETGNVTTSGRTTFFEREEVGTKETLVVNDAGTNAVGDFITNVKFQPFMRSQEIKVYVSGLRPNTQHYFFFDAVDVNSFVSPGTLVDEAREIQRYGAGGDAVLSDSNGVLRAIFNLPAETFYVGDRTLVIADVNQYASIGSAATSKCAVTYHAYNVNVEKTTISTRIPSFSVSASTTTRSASARIVTRSGDPLAQTFFIKQGMGRGSDSVFISKIDLYFKRKSEVNGVTITLREVQNGYPTGIIMPFSQVHLKASQVNVSDDATAVTEIFFEAPVRMDVEKEYAVVIMPDANDPNYLHFTSKVGGLDLTAGSTQGQAVVQDWGDGVLFTSTNNRAWKSYQDEDIKFSLYRHDFDASTGTVTLTNDDHEFFTLSDWNGRFQQGEWVYQENNANTTTFGVSIQQGNNIVVTTGADDFSTSYVSDDYIMIENSAGDKDIFRVVSIDTASQMTLDKPCWFDGTLSSTGMAVIAGKVSYVNRFTYDTIHLKQSSARLARTFTVSSRIFGLDSGVNGIIGTIDNVFLSYIQPFIQKTNDSITTTSIDGVFNDPNDPLVDYTTPLKFGDNNLFTRKGAVVWSKSNDTSRQKPFDINVQLGNKSNSTSTPIVDLELSTLMAYQYKVTNTSSDTSKYISKIIELKEDLDAEDMQVILTGYRPAGTDIKVYLRPQSAQDTSAFDEIPWMELELFEGISTYSSSVDLYDWREFKYRVADANKSGGVITYTGNNGPFNGYRRFAIKIELLAENIWNVPFVKDYRGIALT